MVHVFRRFFEENWLMFDICDSITLWYKEFPAAIIWNLKPRATCWRCVQNISFFTRKKNSFTEQNRLWNGQDRCSHEMCVIRIKIRWKWRKSNYANRTFSQEFAKCFSWGDQYHQHHIWSGVWVCVSLYAFDMSEKKTNKQQQ